MQLHIINIPAWRVCADSFIKRRMQSSRLILTGLASFLRRSQVGPNNNYDVRSQLASYLGFDLIIEESHDKWIRLLLVNDGNEWMKLLNGIDLHELLVESPPKKKPYLGLSEGVVNIIRLAMGMTVYCQITSLLFELWLW